MQELKEKRKVAIRVCFICWWFWLAEAFCRFAVILECVVLHCERECLQLQARLARRANHTGSRRQWQKARRKQQRRGIGTNDVHHDKHTKTAIQQVILPNQHTRHHARSSLPFARGCRVGVWFNFVRAAQLPAVGTCVVLAFVVLAFGAMPGLCCFLRVTPVGPVSLLQLSEEDFHVVYGSRSCQSPIWRWLVNYWLLRLRNIEHSQIRNFNKHGWHVYREARGHQHPGHRVPAPGCRKPQTVTAHRRMPQCASLWNSAVMPQCA